MRLTAQERLTESNLAGDVRNGIWGEVVKLKAIEMEKALEEGVNWEAKTAHEMGDENIPFRSVTPPT